MAKAGDENGGLLKQAEQSSAVSDVFKGLAQGPVNDIYGGEPIPTSLFHYTSADGLLGILGTHKIRFADASFMNDGSEATWGVQLAGLVLDELLADGTEEEKNAGAALKAEIKTAMTAFQPVIFCMSARNNLLNQWRDYGKDVVPYCIEFDVQELQKWQHMSFPILLTKIVYDLTTQETLLKRLLTSIREKASELLGGRKHFDEHEVAPLLRGAASEIIALISRFKNSAFQAEEEWRALCYRPDVLFEKSGYRSSGLGVIPFYEWHAKDGETRLPIKSVTVGPSPYAQLSDLALKRFLDDNGYHVPTYYSTIPIRR